MKKYFPSEEWESYYESELGEVKAIHDFTGIAFREIPDLPYSEYLLYRKESWLYGLKQSDKGREFLKSLWRLNQTKADVKAIREFTHRKE